MHAFPILASTLGKIFQPFFDAMAWVLAGFYAVIPNYAIDITLLTIAVMVVTAPLTIKSTRSMAAMTQLQPKMKELQKKYKHDKVKLNEEMMALYRENNVSPLGGCIPMLIQFPVFIVLYEVINGLTNTTKSHGGTLVADPRYIGHSTAMYADLIKHPGVMKSFGINLAQTAFSKNPFVDRLPFILLILFAIGLQYLQMHQMTKRNGGNQSNPQMQAVQKYMPLIFAVIYIRINAGVNIYFVISSLSRIVLQTLAYRKMPAADSGRVGRIGGAKPGRKTLMERLAEAQQRAMEQQRALQQGTGAKPPAPKVDGGPSRSGGGGSASGPERPRRGQGTAAPGAGSSRGDGRPGQGGSSRRAGSGGTDRPAGGAGRSTGGSSRPAGNGSGQGRADGGGAGSGGRRAGGGPGPASSGQQRRRRQAESADDEASQRRASGRGDTSAGGRGDSSTNGRGTSQSGPDEGPPGGKPTRKAP